MLKILTELYVVGYYRFDDFGKTTEVQTEIRIPRIAIGSILAYIISQLHDVWAFHFWKTKTNGKYLWLRNNLSTMVSQAIDTLIFTFIAFWGLYEINVFISIVLTTYLMKWIVAVIDTPFIYFARKISFDLKE
jgi:uncharacterized integral membrane protein (TIGR00697 family)